MRNGHSGDHEIIVRGPAFALLAVTLGLIAAPARPRPANPARRMALVALRPD